MVALLIRKLMLTALLALLVVTLLERFNPAPPPMIFDFHHADFPVCATVHNGPIEREHFDNPHRRRSDQA